MFHIMSPGPSGLLTTADAEAVAGVLRGGGLAVLPTETGYLLASAASSVPAVRKAFALKGRDLANPMHVACSSLGMAATVATLDERAVAVLGSFTPGPLSVVVPQATGLDNPYVTLNGTVGLRFPDNAATMQVVAALGEPVTATSLNRSGEESVPVDEALLATFDWQGEAVVPVVIDAGSIREKQASTLVRLTGPEPEILREGPVSRAEIDAVLNDQRAG